MIPAKPVKATVKESLKVAVKVGAPTVKKSFTVARTVAVVARAKPVKADVNASTTSKTKQQPTIIVRKQLSKTEHDDSSKLLTPAELRFVDEYLVDLNATRAYLSGHPGVKETTAASEGHRYLRNHKVAEAIQAGRAALSAATGITAERVLKEIASLAYGDARELVEYRIGACRYCWGDGHRFQRTPAEFEHDEAGHDPDKGVFDEKGGVGYSFKKEPHADCPECAGLGKGRMIINDTRNLSQSAVAMYAGVKTSKDGIEVKTHDKVQALDKLARHLGVFKADNEQVKPDGMPPEMIAAAMLSLKKAQDVRGVLLEERRALGFTGD